MADSSLRDRPMAGVACAAAEDRTESLARVSDRDGAPAFCRSADLPGAGKFEVTNINLTGLELLLRRRINAAL